MTDPTNAVREGNDWVRTHQRFSIAAVSNGTRWRPVVTDLDTSHTHILTYWFDSAEEALDYGEFWCWRRQRAHVAALIIQERDREPDSGVRGRDEMPTLDLDLDEFFSSHRS